MTLAKLYARRDRQASDLAATDRAIAAAERAFRAEKRLWGIRPEGIRAMVEAEMREVANG